MAMVLFKPSGELVKMFLEYYKAAGRNIEQYGPFHRIQEGIGYTFRHALLTFGIKISDLPIRLCAIIESEKLGFTVSLDEIFRNYLKIKRDDAGDRLLEKFAEEFKDWLEDMGGELEAEEEGWPYKRVYLMDNGNVIMDLNLKGVIISAENIH
ncbi:MAG: hypothetical protein Q8R55_06505 [Candidatus Taylorbacteria bacterium]|nr:hypothetical protein [Candidatus Taylorbacteria bacterium]